jgi:RimJ/RimL family protein N-acetyltransferase
MARMARMSAQPRLSTERLLLRRWRDSDREPFAAINADPEVMEHNPAPLARERSDALIERYEAAFERYGYGLWAVELPGERPLAGYVGLFPVEIEVAFAPAVQLAWRLARDCWGRGIATEAARAAIAFAFDEQGIDELVAYTAAVNERSRRVMERLDMTRDPAGDFRHPDGEVSGRLEAHVLYRLAARDWRGSPDGGS